MSETQKVVEEVSSHVALIQMETAYWESKILYAAAKFDLADQLATVPKSVAELAGPLKVHAPSLR